MLDIICNPAPDTYKDILGNSQYIRCIIADKDIYISHKDTEEILSYIKSNSARVYNHLLGIIIDCDGYMYIEDGERVIDDKVYAWEVLHNIYIEGIVGKKNYDIFLDVESYRQVIIDKDCAYLDIDVPRCKMLVSELLYDSYKDIRLMGRDDLEKVLGYNGNLIRYIDHPDKSLYMMAVNQNADSIKYILDNCDDEVILTALKKDISIFRYIMGILTYDLSEEIQEYVIGVDSSLVEYILHPSYNIQKKILDANVMDLSYILDIDSRIQLEAITRDYTNIQYIAYPDEDIQKHVMEINPYICRLIQHKSKDTIIKEKELNIN